MILGFSAPKGSRIGIGALILGHKKQGKLHCIGKVGTGFNTALLKTLAAKLKRIEKSHPPCSGAFPKDTHFVTPKYYCQVAFTEWTNKGKLRHSKFLKMVEKTSG